MQRKRTVEREAIERAAPVCGLGCSTSGESILALIEKRSGFLSAERFDAKAQTVLQNLEFGRCIAVDRARYEWQTFERAHARVIAFDHRARFEFLNQYLDQQRLNSVSAL